MKAFVVSRRGLFLATLCSSLVAWPAVSQAQTNAGFSIFLAQPTNASVFIAPVNVQLAASVYDPQGQVASVEFTAAFSGGGESPVRLLGVVSNFISLDPPNKTYLLEWSNAPSGNWTLGAVAIGDNGASVAAAPVQISVQNGYSLSVAITAPVSGATYSGPTNIPIIAGAQSSNDAPDFVTFYDNSQLFGVVSNFVVMDPGPGFPRGGRAYFWNWTNQSSGLHDLTASVTDTNGFTAWSSAVTVTIGNPNSFAIQVVTPTNDQVFTQPAQVPMDASVLAADSSLAFVNFTASGPPYVGPEPEYVIELGAVSNGVSINPPRVDYIYVWSNAPAGNWWVTATAFNTKRTAVGSATVQFQVVNNSTNTNSPPIVRLTSPPNNTLIHAPINLALMAYAFDPAGFVKSVQFFAGSNSLGFGLQLTNPAVEPNPSPGFPPYPIYLTNMYELTWSNPDPGAYALTAVATVNSGVMATSAPVDITIPPPPPPPTNFPALVSIVATDPIAIEGTNCWPWLGGPPTWSNWVSPVAVWRWFTNCGPKDATFTVYRNGSTNQALSVFYSIGGTATNGVDYAGLPGNLKIPAGQTEAMITVVPLDDGPPDRSSTVVLTLQPDTNAPVAYVVGEPRRAEVIIIDTMGPRPLSRGAVLPDGSFHLSLTGPDGAWFHVDYSTDLSSWTPLCTNQVVNGSIDFLDPDAANSPVRIYRAVPLSNPPSN